MQLCLATASRRLALRANAARLASQPYSRRQSSLEFTMLALDRVSGVSIQGCLALLALTLYSVLIHPVWGLPPASFPPLITETQLPLAI